MLGRSLEGSTASSWGGGREQGSGTFSQSRHLVIHGLIQATQVQILAMSVELKKQSKAKWKKVHNEESPAPCFSILVPFSCGP